MFLKITTKQHNKKIYKQASIVETVREEGKVKQHLIKNLGSVNTETELKRAQELLECFKKGEQLVTIGEVANKRTFEFGAVYTTQQLWSKYGITKKLSSALGPKHMLVFQMAVARLHQPSSELSTVEWINNEAYVSERKKTNAQQLYRALDCLINKKEEVEKAIFNSMKQKLKLNTSQAFYDLTSSYFEGKCCRIAMFGHSRDHRRDREQIVIGIVMVDGIPVMHEVFEGNVLDKQTLKGTAEKLKNNLGITNAAFIADRGIITEDNLEVLEALEYEYIIGCPRRNNNKAKELLVKNISSKEEQFAKQVLREEFEKNNKKYVRRYILCLNNKTRKERLKTLKQIKNQKEKKLRELQQKYAKPQESKKGKKMERDSLMQQALKALGKNKRLFNLDFDNGLKFSLNKKSFEYEKKIAGKFLLVTNTKLEPVEVMKAYKQLQEVENAFDEIKNFLDVRPIYHHANRRVKAHVFICMLAFLTEKIIQKLTSVPPQKTIRSLKRIKISVHNIDSELIHLVDKPTKKETTLFKQLDIEPPQRIF